MFLLKACVAEFPEAVPVFKRFENRQFCWLFRAYLFAGTKGRVIWTGIGTWIKHVTTVKNCIPKIVP